ncbi:MAG: ATP-binding protein, partial [Planctomycetes bacterium]|nr:ATP-binding protein [Planctomycetota bacterium]
FGEPSGPTESSVEAPAQPEGQNPIYRHTFVGREAEVRQLHSAFDSTLSGEGSLVMVVGEPGIGKTALCEQLADHVAGRGGRTLVGHCYEEGSLSLPYLAFVEVMRSLVLGQEPDRLAQDLGTGAGLIARIVPEVRERIEKMLAKPDAP